MNILWYIIPKKIDWKKLPDTEDITVVSEKTACMIFRYCEKNLAEVIKHERSKGKPMRRILFLRILLDMLEGVYQMQECNIVHRDLKPDNIMVTNCGNSLITDFELKLKFEKKDKFKVKFTEEYTVGGATFYLPPEIMKKHKVGDYLDYSKSDIFSVGCIAYEMLGDNSPFLKYDGEKGKLVSANDREKSIDNYQKLSKDIDSDLRDIVNKMIHPKFEKRYDCKSALEIVKNLYFNEIKKKKNMTIIRKKNNNKNNKKKKKKKKRKIQQLKKTIM